MTVRQLDKMVVHLTVILFGPPRDECDESMSLSLYHVPVMLPCNAIVCPSDRPSCCLCCQHGHHTYCVIRHWLTWHGTSNSPSYVSLCAHYTGQNQSRVKQNCGGHAQQNSPSVLFRFSWWKWWVNEFIFASSSSMSPNRATIVPCNAIVCRSTRLFLLLALSVQPPHILRYTKQCKTRWLTLYVTQRQLEV